MIKEFHIKDAQKLADMFNASDEGWPGGFTHGMPITPEIVLEYKKKEDTISTLVAWDENRIIGILELTEFWRDTNVLYVSFLNVIPSHHGKGYGRDLLKACVQKATELQCKRLDLHTWSGNMKAVPLYKKTGFFWVPKTLVHMKNFIPFIQNMDAAKPYFEKHDWYTAFKRELKVEEDDFDGVYPYRWEKDQDVLSVVIDAESGGVTEFENNTFSVSQKVEDPFAGKSVKVTWTVKNKTDALLNVNLISRGEKGISIEKKESFTIDGEKEYETTGEAFIDPDIEIRKENEPPHVVTTDVIINGLNLSLSSGLRVKHPVEVSTYPEYLFLPKGEQKILVVLKNNQKVKAEGVITCWNTGESGNFLVDPEHTEAVPFSITVDKDGELLFSVQDTPPVHTIPVRVIDAGANVMQKGEEVILENAHTRIVIFLRGGETSFFDKRTKEFWAKHMGDELGPPFWPSELFKTMYTVRTEQYAGRVVAEFTVKSKKYDTKIIRRIEMDSSPVIKIQHSMIPQRDVSLHCIGEGELDGGILTLPLKEGIVSEVTMEDVFPLEDGDIPKEPSEYKEQWVCYEREGSAFGVVWERCTEMEVQGYTLLNITMSAEDLNPFYVYAGSGTWKDVQALWSRVHRKEVAKEEPVRIWEVNPSVVITVNDTVTPEFTLESHRNRPFKGVINGDPFDIKRKNPFTFTTVYDNLELGVTTKYIHMETDLFEKKVPVSLVRAGTPRDITICENDIIEIDNGLYIVKVAPHYYGSLIYFGKDENHLLTPYPETTQLSWFRPWYGGIHPVVYQSEEKFPGRMHKETFTYQIVDTEKCGIVWKGVKVISTLKEIKGIKVQTSYLTTAGSNLLVVEHTLVNLSSAPFTANTGVSFFLQPEGSVKEATLYYSQNELQERRRTQYGGWVRCKDWAAVKGGETYLTLIHDSFTAGDMGKEGVHLFTAEKVEVKPQKDMKKVSFFAVTDSLDQSQQYKAMRRTLWI